MKANTKATNLITKRRKEVYKRCARGDKKDSRKAIPFNPARQIFEVFTSVPALVATQGDIKPNKLPVRPKKSWIRY